MPPTHNTQILSAEATQSQSRSRRFAVWGFPLAVFALALSAGALIWSKGELFGLPSKDARIAALLWTASALVVIVFLHSIALMFGAYAMAARLFRHEAGAGNEPRATRFKRDPRLQYVIEELRVAHGWRWRNRTPWLMLTGSDERIDEAAPGLKQAGAMLVAGTVLVHAAPDGIEAAQWRRHISRARRRRPVDSLVHVVRMGEGARLEFDQARKLAAIASDLGWAAPITFLHTVEASGGQPERFEAVGAWMTARTSKTKQAAAGTLSDDLIELEWLTASPGVELCVEQGWIRYLAQVSKYIGDQRDRIVENWTGLVASGWLRAQLAGVMFAPVYGGAGRTPVPVPEEDAVDAMQTTSTGHPAGTLPAPAAVAMRGQPASLIPAWQSIGSSALCRRRGKRVGFHWPNALAALATACAIGWCAALTVSFIGNRQLVLDAQAVAHAALAAQPGTPDALRAQLALQLQIDTLEYRHEHGAPWYLRAGLSRNDALLDALWSPYAAVAARNLQRPVVASLEKALRDMSEARADALQTESTRQSGYRTLKTYLMLAEPQRTDAAFLGKALVASWPLPSGMSVGERDDLARRLAGFYAGHLSAHPEWRAHASDALVTGARKMLVNQLGLANADDTVYESMLASVRGKYADASLATLLDGADARGLFSTAQTVPGIYTRAAWDGAIADAIEKAADERRASGDWVLGGDERARSGAKLAERAGGATSAADDKRAAQALKQRLAARYFAEYTAAWQRMLNSIRWQPAASLNEAIDQLTRLADAQTSPVIALMKTIAYQAQAGQRSEALADRLVRRAQDLIGRKSGDNSDDNRNSGTQTPAIDPLDKSFGPLLALMGDLGAAGAGDSKVAGGPVTLSGVSLARYLTVATTMRLKLQQIAASPDAQALARLLAQAIFQGKSSDLSQAREDAALTAASLGAQWAGFGDALFARPLDAAWQTILQPAAASLNEAWRNSVAMPFRTTFDGRYPFLETNADASFAELGRYVRPDTGLVSRFVMAELRGILRREGDQWVPEELAPRLLQIDPAFLAALRQLSTIGAQAYAQGDAGYRFEIMPLPSAQVTRTELVVDGKPIVYFNQRQSWTALTWPGDGLNGRAGLMWQMVNAGLREAFDTTGDWAFLRLLAKAQVKQLDSSRYELTWDQPDAAPLRYVLRTQLGAGPLDLLKLRGFRMPERIFLVGRAGAMHVAHLAQPTDASMPRVPVLPPLPPSLQ
ncbi:ImcF-related family protein [Paraburkholderia sp. SARCC-3016]|uniref:ImcF-related family protein n=1 Tax=Paraburkholderia sp. SARCC-3016 TaxID=3058611 RepID=UPI002809C1CD|nr:ImcF-related family protein [Paraburkholderia sp. SARCC-3016]MDQ7977574.1 ImcF-related family protein [Paraburkholderia sp. SARCC-3016]